MNSIPVQRRQGKNHQTPPPVAAPPADPFWIEARRRAESLDQADLDGITDTPPPVCVPDREWLRREAEDRQRHEDGQVLARLCGLLRTDEAKLGRALLFLLAPSIGELMGGGQ